MGEAELVLSEEKLREANIESFFCGSDFTSAFSSVSGLDTIVGAAEKVNPLKVNLELGEMLDDVTGVWLVSWSPPGVTCFPNEKLDDWLRFGVLSQELPNEALIGVEVPVVGVEIPNLIESVDKINTN